MDITNPQRAKVLVHALPYIQEYSGKIVVIKYGGNAMISEKLKDSVMRDIVLLSLIGVQVVLVHGGGPEITDMLQKLGKQTQFVDGLRVTDAETADVVQMVLAGKINKTLVNLIGQKGGRAIGLSGIDGQMIQARVRDERLGDLARRHVHGLGRCHGMVCGKVAVGGVLRLLDGAAHVRALGQIKRHGGAQICFPDARIHGGACLFDSIGHNQLPSIL